MSPVWVGQTKGRWEDPLPGSEATETEPKWAPFIVGSAVGRIITHHSSPLGRGSPLTSFGSFLRCLVFSKATPAPSPPKTDPPSPSVSSCSFFFVSSSHRLTECIFTGWFICLILFFSLECGLHEGRGLAWPVLCCLWKA